MTRQTIYFLGISTTGSVIRKVFPAWADLLGINADLKTIDLPAGAPPDSYRQFVTHLKDDPSLAGAVITAHKTALYQHAGDLFTHLEPISERIEEISVIRTHPAGLEGTVIEPRSLFTTLHEMGGGAPVTNLDRDLVVFGAGGTAVSLIVCLTDADWPIQHRPRKLHLVDTSIERLQHAHQIATSGKHPIHVNVLHSPGAITLNFLGDLTPGALILNATGLGKDRPGAPLALPAPWPDGAHVWDLNYRGDLVMLDDARGAPIEKKVTAHDGWWLFINGWAESLSHILERPIEHTVRMQMDGLARGARS